MVISLFTVECLQHLYPRIEGHRFKSRTRNTEFVFKKKKKTFKRERLKRGKNFMMAAFRLILSIKPAS